MAASAGLPGGFYSKIDQKVDKSLKITCVYAFNWPKIADSCLSEMSALCRTAVNDRPRGILLVQCLARSFFVYLQASFCLSLVYFGLLFP